MAKNGLKSLQQAARAANLAQNPQEKQAELAKAYKLFSNEAAGLEKTYSEIKEQIEKANEELKKSNFKLKYKLDELDEITYYLNNILSNISQGILFIDLSGVVTTYNAAAVDILKVAHHKVLFNPFHACFNDNLFGFSLQEALSSKKAPCLTYTQYALRGGVAKELEIQTKMMLHESEKLEKPTDAMQGMIVLIRDITEIRRLELIATRHDRMEELGEMAAMVAHEIRNPLGGIKGFASLLKRDLQSQPEMEKLADYIIKGTDSLNKLVNTILNYTRPVKPSLETTDVNQLLRELHDLLKADIGIDPSIHLKLLHRKDPIYAPVDPQLMKSALLNLLMNGIQAMPQGGRLSYGVLKEESLAIIKVTDTGEGIPPENMEKIYSPFFTTRVNGNGFGLSEALKIVQAHGGTLKADSQVGKGTTFTIKIPTSKG